MIDLDPADATTTHALAVTRAELSPSSADKARLRAALRLPPAPQLRETTAPIARVAALQASGRLGMALGALLFGAGVVTGWQLRPSARTASERLPVAPPVIEVPPAAALLPAAPESAGHEMRRDSADTAAAAEAADAERAKPRPRHSPARARDTIKPLDEELALLRRVERALRNEDPALALALLAELDQRFPQTRLAEERLAARTMAECRQQVPGALLHAQAFLRAHPASVYSERVRSACATPMAESDSVDRGRTR